MSGQAPATLRVLTWNIHGCVGRSGRFDPDAVAAAVAAVDPDVVALQEVDSRRPVAGGVDTFEALAAELGGSAFAARTIVTHEGDYGHMLLSRWPLTACRRLDLSVPGREPRAAILATAHTPGLDVAVVAAHLGLKSRERAYQVETIAGALRRDDDGPAVVLGDFNEWRRRGAATRRLCPPFRPAATLASFPARRPMLPLDRVWCRAPLMPHAARALTEARDLSDHLAVLAELTIDRREPRPTPGETGRDPAAPPRLG
jgi:endonuclease/exonuclease/phosphatase family metal-dependent hydrolase